MGAAWSKTYWPVLRELLQNTMDHLHLLKDGRLNPALHVTVTSDDNDRETSIQFMCGSEPVCTISTPSDDEVQIEQLYTFPLPSRALDTGVPDTVKRSSSSHAAGGFGDGFKTAAVALLASKKDPQASLEWIFYSTTSSSSKTKISWIFEGSTREAVSTFAECRVLQVRIEKQSAGAGLGASSKGQDHVMHQIIKAKGIGSTFWKEAVPKMQMFWELNPQHVISTKQNGCGNFIGNPVEHALAGGGTNRCHPASGVYVRGIWVRSAKIPGTIMSFNCNYVQVSGRDRNDVFEEDLIEAVAKLFRRCANVDLLRDLLSPLRGKSKGTTADDADDSLSWLVDTGRSGAVFLNRILESEKEYILHHILQVPIGALFVSRKTTESTEPFIQWAAEFLKSRGAPIFPIEPGANKYLFEEVTVYELKAKCVHILKQDLKHADDDDLLLRSSVHELLKFMSRNSYLKPKVFFSTSVRVPFVHEGRQMFLPQATLNRELLVKVLNLCQTHLGYAGGEFSSLMQALFETLKDGLTPVAFEDVKNVVARAKIVLEESRNYFAGNASTTGTRSNGAPARTDGDRGFQACPPEPHSPSGSNGDSGAEARVPETNSPARSDGDRNAVKCTPEPHSLGTVENPEGVETRPSTFEDLKRRIEEVTNLTKDLPNNNKKRRTDNSDEESIDPIIPEGSFGSDNTDTRLLSYSDEKHSELKLIVVSETLGGGKLFCDSHTAESIHEWNLSKSQKLVELRELLVQVGSTIQNCIPNLSPLLGRVRHGYDSAHNSYEGFYDHQRKEIVVNFCSFMHRLPTTSADARALLFHDLILMLTHELAHYLEPRAGHGPVWHDTHMKLVSMIMSKTCNNGT